MYFITIQQAIDRGTGKAAIRGWVYRERKSNARAFIVMRDGTNIIQCVIEKANVTPEVWAGAEKVLIESAAMVEGEIFKDDRAPTGFELRVSSFKLVHLAERFPITKDQSTEFLLDQRHLWLRSRELTAVWKVKQAVLEACREFHKQLGYVEVTPPIITGSACEGGSTLFELKYFDEKAYLSQSAQLYLEAMIFSLEKVWALTPSFRAEPSKTNRHLTEYWHLEMEAAWMDFEGLLSFEEGLVSHICQYVAGHCTAELKILGRNPTDLENITPPFPRITYDEALEILKKDGMEVPWGKDLRTNEEEQLMKHYDKPLLVTRYPKAIKAFYMKDDPKRDDVALCCDVLAPEGYGEIIGSSERETDIEVIRKKLAAAGEKEENYAWYLDLRRFGSVQHSGFGLGIERVVRWLCKLESIRDAIPFPRTIKRKYP
ncbi:asparagine--tRNA ligase [Candidatus Woesearchaeota archaeon]|nr:asparagine--tRNA ligase [Candidatus Woesearchaeota archaeon]